VRSQGRRALEAGGLLVLDLSRERRIGLRWRAEPEDGAAPGFQVVRVYGASGELLAPVPVLEFAAAPSRALRQTPMRSPKTAPK